MKTIQSKKPSERIAIIRKEIDEKEVKSLDEYHVVRGEMLVALFNVITDILDEFDERLKKLEEKVNA